MSNTFYPRTVQGLLSVLNSHLSGWEANAVGVGLNPTQVTNLKNAKTATEDRLTAADSAREKSKSATLDLNESADTLRTLAQQALDRIRLFAESSANPTAVYVLANVPAPTPPSPLPPPEAPTDVNADPNADGTATISWKGTVAGASFFTIWRKVGESGAWTQIGAVAAKKFTDFMVPNPGTTNGATLFYGLRTQRNVEVSAMSVTATITYGNGPGFAAFGSEFNAQSGKLAA